jgi:hypothetical protein
LFELTDAMLCTDGPITSLVGLSVAPEHRRDHGALRDGLNRGQLDTGRPRAMPAALPPPRTDDGRILLAVDVSN